MGGQGGIGILPAGKLKKRGRGKRWKKGKRAGEEEVTIAHDGGKGGATKGGGGRRKTQKKSLRGMGQK